jgi:hypothetical protein
MGSQLIENVLADIEILEILLERERAEHHESDQLVTAIQAVLDERYTELNSLRHGP